MLTQRHPPGSYTLVPQSTWHPHPTIEDRAAWERLPQSVREAYVSSAVRSLEKPWDILAANRYLDFARDGNRSRFEALHFGRRQKLTGLIVAECIENEGRFLDDIVNGLWLLAEETSWCLPAHIGMQKAGTGLPDDTEPIVDLFAAETGALVAWTVYLLEQRLDAVSPQVLPRLRREVVRRILVPCRTRDDFWWMGLRGGAVNNWNPWVTSNWLTCTLLLETDESVRTADVAKAVRCLDAFVGPYPTDGGCDEGPGYWTRAGASLYDCLELLLSATNGRFDEYSDPLIRNIGRFIYRVHIADHYVVNFADAPALSVPPPALVFGYGRRIGDTDMERLGAWAAHETDLWRRQPSDKPITPRISSLGRLLEEFARLPDMEKADPRPPLPRDTWLDVIQVMVARDRAGSADGFFLAAKGGHNNESHNHNDVGHFIVYLDGRPLLIDAGVETYSRKTFSPERYNLWTMQSAFHNLPTVDGVQQAPGREFAARDVRHTADDASATLELDIAGAYPATAKLRSWHRRLTLLRGRHVELTDTYERESAPGTVTLTLLTPCDPDLSKAGRVVLRETALAGGRRSAAGVLEYDASRLEVAVETIAIADAQLRSAWGDRLARLIFTLKRPAARDGWTVRIGKK